MRNVFLCGPLVLVLLAAPGCSGKKGPEASDPDEARALLMETLEAWRQGATPAELRQRDPPTHVADEEWQAGSKLLRFRITDPGAVFGPSLRCQVELVLESRQRGGVTETVRYQVSTRPGRSVVRSDSK